MQHYRKLIPKICQHCGQDFQARTDGPGKYCSRSCASGASSRRVPVHCMICGGSFSSKPARLESGRGKYCSRSCAAQGLRKSIEVALADYDVDPVTGCHVYRGSKDTDGYAVAGKKPRHRLCRTILERYYGVDIASPNIVAMHSCDNPPCINPAHISPGTVAENTADMVTKRRHTFGERSSNAKLTEESVRAIRRSYSAGEQNQAQLAVSWGVSNVLISLIVRRKAWAHVA